MGSARILVATPSKGRLREIKSAFLADGYDVSTSGTFEGALQEISSQPFDVLILESALGDVAQYNVCRAVRSISDMGIILLCQDDGRHARIDALNAGADDCVSMPLDSAELLARVRALLRRVGRTNLRGLEQIPLEDRAIDLALHKVRGPLGRITSLTPNEYLLLRYLVVNANKPLGITSLKQVVRQRHGKGKVDYVRALIRRLRKKLEPDPANPRYILTERSFGYRFQIDSVANNGRPSVPQ